MTQISLRAILPCGPLQKSIYIYTMIMHYIIKTHYKKNNILLRNSKSSSDITSALFKRLLIGKGPQTFSTVFTHTAGDFGLIAQNPLTENGLLFMILSSSAVPVWDSIKTRIIKLFERKHWVRIYRSVKN